MDIGHIKNIHIYVLQSIFVFGISYGSVGINLDDTHKLCVLVARYVLYFLLIKATELVCLISIDSFKGKRVDVTKLLEDNKSYFLLFVISFIILVYSKERLLNEDFALLFVAHIVMKYPEMNKTSSTTAPCPINYGVGMACSFFEGYLTHIIPSDGARFVGFQENISIYEAKQGIRFPVKRLFLVITKSLFCPPDMSFFNKPNRRELAQIEACESLEEVEKDVAGVKNRTYKNSAYRINRPARPPVYVTAEFATPLHTLHKVLEKKALYDKLAEADVSQIVDDFCTTLADIIARSFECRGKCELVFFDNTDESQNLADVLLEKIREIEEDFENLIVAN